MWTMHGALQVLQRTLNELRALDFAGMLMRRECVAWGVVALLGCSALDGEVGVGRVKTCGLFYTYVVALASLQIRTRCG